MLNILVYVTLPLSHANYNQNIYRGSYISAHVLLKLLKKLGKRDKMRGLPSVLSLFCNKLNNFNNMYTGA